jgi:nickel-type superoxide dismutase maturation protease
LQARWPTFGQVAATIALLWGGALVLNRATRRVEGSSMLPTLRPGDLVLTRPARRVHVGQLVVMRDPREPARTVVKRVASVTPQGVVVRGDNPAWSTDSRTFGAVPVERVESVVVCRWWPLARRGVSRERRAERVRSPRRWG